jgi:hypothetical protein
LLHIVTAVVSTCPLRSTSLLLKRRSTRMSGLSCFCSFPGPIFRARWAVVLTLLEDIPRRLRGIFQKLPAVTVAMLLCRLPGIWSFRRNPGFLVSFDGPSTVKGLLWPSPYLPCPCRPGCPYVVNILRKCRFFAFWWTGLMFLRLMGRQAVIVLHKTPFQSASRPGGTPLLSAGSSRFYSRTTFSYCQCSNFLVTRLSP